MAIARLSWTARRGRNSNWFSSSPGGETAGSARLCYSAPWPATRGSVKDPDRSLSFYGAVFGVREYFRDGVTIQVFGPGPHNVVAFEKRPADACARGGVIHFGFRLVRADDIDAAVAAVEEAGRRTDARFRGQKLEPASWQSI